VPVPAALQQTANAMLCGLGLLPELNVPEELDPHHKPVPEMEIFD
jgi:hypothetical protein